MTVSSRGKWLQFHAFLVLLISGSILAMWLASRIQPAQDWRDVTPAPCLRDSFKNVVLVIVYNYPLYTSIPLLKRLYGNAFSTIVFCGPKPDKDDLEHPIEQVYHKKGYFGYMCLARAMEKHTSEIQPKRKTESFLNSFSRNSERDIVSGFHGYLVISDDVMLNFWNFLGFDRRQIWEGPKVPLQYPGFAPKRKWYWWKSRWGMSQCQKAYNEIWALRNEMNLWNKLNVNESLEILARNGGQGHRFCHRGRSDVYYVPRRFSEIFQLLAHIFYKHGVFLEIAVPTILRMLDLEVNFEKIPGIYLPGRANESVVKDNKYFWQVYNKGDYFVHPLKLNYPDSEMSRALLETWVNDYIKSITLC